MFWSWLHITNIRLPPHHARKHQLAGRVPPATSYRHQSSSTASSTTYCVVVRQPNTRGRNPLGSRSESGLAWAPWPGHAKSHAQHTPHQQPPSPRSPPNNETCCPACPTPLTPLKPHVCPHTLPLPARKHNSQGWASAICLAPSRSQYRTSHALPDRKVPSRCPPAWTKRTLEAFLAFHDASRFPPHNNSHYVTRA